MLWLQRIQQDLTPFSQGYFFYFSLGGEISCTFQVKKQTHIFPATGIICSKKYLKYLVVNHDKTSKPLFVFGRKYFGLVALSRAIRLILLSNLCAYWFFRSFTDFSYIYLSFFFLLYALCLTEQLLAD